jgi:hypothetical protein
LKGKPRTRHEGPQALTLPQAPPLTPYAKFFLRCNPLNV